MTKNDTSMSLPRIGESLQNSSTPQWNHLSINYRSEEMETIVHWIGNGESGSVVGLSGVGRSKLLNFLYSRSDAVGLYLTDKSQPIGIVPVDLNILPDYTVVTLYRVILRSFWYARHQFPDSLSQIIDVQYNEFKVTNDPFLAQSALWIILEKAKINKIRIVWILNRFDEFCEIATSEMIRTLRSMRDSFKETLCYIVGMLRDVAHLPDLVLVESLRDVLDMNVCWVGPLNEVDAREMIMQELRGASIEENHVDWILQLTGGHPELIRIICHWWLSQSFKPLPENWVDSLLEQKNVRRRLEKIWNSLTQEEQFTASEIQKLQFQPTLSQKKRHKILKTHQDTLSQLKKIKICHQTQGKWFLFGTLFAHYIGHIDGRGRGLVWLDKKTDELFQGQTRIEGLTHLERTTLHFFIQNAYIRHSHSEIIEAVWPDDVQKVGVSTETLYQTIRGVRKNIEPNPSKPVYIISRRGQPEGSYQFFPEGIPNG